MRTPTLYDTGDLSVHPMIKPMPRWAKNDERFGALAEDVREWGILQPLKIDKERRIIDGWKCWEVAKRLGLQSVPCIVIPEDDIAGTILSGLLQRAHHTKGQRAYLAYPLLAHAHEEAKRRRIEKLRKGQQIPVVHSGNNGKVEDFAERLGIGRTLFWQASEIHRHFANPKKFAWVDERKQLTLKEYFEPRILREDDPVGLGAAIAGIGAKLSGAVESQGRAEQLELFTRGIDTLRTRFAYWMRFSAAEKLAASREIQTTVAVMPEDLREAFEGAIRAAKRREAA